MPEIIALSCPVCGAPLAPGSEQCAYCGSYIVIKTDLPKLERHSLNQALIQEHIADFRKRIRTDQYDEEAHYGLGLAYYSLGLIDDSIEELTQAARLMPENPNIQSQLAVALYDSWVAGDASAETKLNQRISIALMLDPKNTEASLLRAKIYVELKRYPEANEAIQYVWNISNPHASERMISYIHNIGEQCLDTSRWEVASWCWRTLQPIDRQATKDLAQKFLGLQSTLIPRRFQKKLYPPVHNSIQYLDAANSGNTFANRVILALLSSLVGGILGTFIMIIMSDIGSTISSGSSVLESFGVLIFFALLIAFPIVYWMKSEPLLTSSETQGPPSIAPSAARSPMVIEADSATVVAAAEATMDVIRSRYSANIARQSSKSR